MFNLSFQTAQVPEDWHRAHVSPVAKILRTTNPRQFRLISLKPVVCNILETILKEKLLSHLSKLSLLTKRQHGFFPHRSAVTNLLSAGETVARWFDKGNTVDIVYPDFIKAFDSVSHRCRIQEIVAPARRVTSIKFENPEIKKMCGDTVTVLYCLYCRSNKGLQIENESVPRMWHLLARSGLSE